MINGELAGSNMVGGRRGGQPDGRHCRGMVKEAGAALGMLGMECGGRLQRAVQGKQRRRLRFSLLNPRLLATVRGTSPESGMWGRDHFSLGSSSRYRNH